MKQVVSFLRELSLNNERGWFQAHKDDYLEALERFNAVAEEIIRGIEAFDPSIRGLGLKDCTYRIYRDLRFSKDKRPYKTHMGVYVCPGGKKSGMAGYYFHVGTGLEDGYPGSHLLCVGDYRGEREVLRTIREDIEAGGDDFDAAMRSAEGVGLKLDEDYRMKRMPKGFREDGPWADYLMYKCYCLIGAVDEDFLFAPNLAERVCDVFRSTKPFLDFVNRAIGYVQEEKNGGMF